VLPPNCQENVNFYFSLFSVIIFKNKLIFLDDFTEESYFIKIVKKNVNNLAFLIFGTRFLEKLIFLDNFNELLFFANLSRKT